MQPWDDVGGANPKTSVSKVGSESDAKSQAHFFTKVYVNWPTIILLPVADWAKMDFGQLEFSKNYEEEGEEKNTRWRNALDLGRWELCCFKSLNCLNFVHVWVKKREKLHFAFVFQINCMLLCTYIIILNTCIALWAFFFLSFCRRCCTYLRFLDIYYSPATFRL